jgi:hypothetical protein
MCVSNVETAMTDSKKFKQLVRDRMQRTGESYTTAKRNLESGFPESTQRTVVTAPSAADEEERYRKNRQRFRSKSLGAWKPLTSSIAVGAPRVEWADPLQIVPVLNRIAREAHHNHAHFPTSGGLDLHGAALSNEVGCVELDLGGEGSIPYITRPVRLVLNVMKDDPLGEWAYFWYETAPLASSGVYGDVDPRFTETVLELQPCQYVDSWHWEAGYYETNDDGGKLPLPDSARIIRRHLFGGPFLIVSKGSSWNLSNRLGDYSGGHAKRSEPEFATFMQALVDELRRRNVYGVEWPD